MTLTNEQLIEILNDALYDYVEDTSEEWLQSSLARSNNNELEFVRLMADRSVSSQQIEQLKAAHGIDSSHTIPQMLEHFIVSLGGQKWSAEHAAALRDEAGD